MKLYRIVVGLILTSIITPASFAQDIIPLDGTWNFKVEGAKAQTVVGNTIKIPGTMDEARYGYPSAPASIDNQWTFGWRRPLVYEGVAIYQREIDIPKSWQDQTIQLFIEQTRGETTVSIDGKAIGETINSLVTSHLHILGKLTPGKHTLCIRLDNSKKYGIGGSYIRSAMGQGNWNGMVGKIELRCKQSSYINNVVFTPSKDNTATVEFECCGDAPKLYLASIYDGDTLISSAQGDSPVLKIDISDLQLWDEFNPHCYTLETSIRGRKVLDIRKETVGIRFVESNKQHQFCINGRPIFLRGTVSYNIFPLTGYPSTDVADWENIFSIYKDWGMNHVRFHSLTPPVAAFEAADRLGIYLQCEAPKAGRVGKTEDDSFHIAEGKRILHDYGNHPSFILMSMGNELAGEVKDIQNICDKVREGDSRRLYTTTTGSSKVELKDDYKIYGGIVRGFKGPFTDWDYREVARKIDRTMLSHEVGQWNTFPDIGIIDKYKGMMRPDNLVLVKEEMERKGLLNKAGLFTQITGKFAALLFKDEMEAIMRTPDYGGFQILMLNDFPAQGTATSGMLDIFNDEKGYIKAETFREYCAPVVPLLRINKRIFSSREQLQASVDLSCYTAQNLNNAGLSWMITDGNKVYKSGKIDAGCVKTGNVYPVGTISADLDFAVEAMALQIVVALDGTSFKNRWNIWVYPDDKDTTIPSDIEVTSSWSNARTKLAQGRKVLFFPSADELAQWRPGQFKTIFWSPIWLKRGIETMSVLADIHHPALKSFPTDIHTDWQWFSVLENSLSFSIDPLPMDFKPIVGLIDSYRKNQRLANTIEAKVGEGRLLMTTIDLMRNLDGDPARASLKKSIVDYMSTDKFNPQYNLTINQLDNLFKKTISCNDKYIPEGKTVIDMSADGSNKYSAQGYSCKISSKVQKSGDLSAWADKRDLDINITAPKNTSGMVHLYLRNSKSSRWGMLKTPQEIAEVDWVEETFENYGNKKPVCCVIINGEYIQTLHNFGSTGHYYSVPIEPEYLKDGKMTIRLSTFNFPNILTELIFDVK